MAEAAWALARDSAGDEVPSPTVSRRRMHHGHHSGVHASPLRWALLSREAMAGNGHTILFANYCVLRNLETSHVVEVIGL